MDASVRERLLRPPAGRIHAVIDTDTFNEADDQFALAYLLRSRETVRIDAIYAAPFLNEKSASPEDGMRKSLTEIHRVLTLTGAEEYRAVTLPGAGAFLPDERTPVPSPAAEDLIRRAREHGPEDPLYVLGIAAATDLASALLMAPDILERVVFVWLGGSAFHRQGEAEFNLMEDYAAARVLFESGAALVQVPCWGVAEHFSISRPELERYLLGRNPLADYLARRAMEEAESYAAGLPWTKTIWDMAAAAWLVDREARFLRDKLVSAPIPEPDGSYRVPEVPHLMRYVYRIDRDALMADLIKKLIQKDVTA